MDGPIIVLVAQDSKRLPDADVRIFQCRLIEVDGDLRLLALAREGHREDGAVIKRRFQFGHIKCRSRCCRRRLDPPRQHRTRGLRGGG